MTGLSAQLKAKRLEPSHPAGTIDGMDCGLFVDGGVLSELRPDWHIAASMNGQLVCVRPAHEGMDCHVQLAA